MAYSIRRRFNGVVKRAVELSARISRRGNQTSVFSLMDTVSSIKQPVEFLLNNFSTG